MKKRLLAVLMCFCIAFSMIPGMAFASERVYVALGDSITTGYGLSNVGTESFPALVAEENTLALTNLAKDGATSAGLLEVVQDTNNAAILSSADVITITIGGNDLMDALYGYIADEYNDKNNPDPPITASDVKDNILQYFEFAETVLPNFVGSATAKTAMQTLGSNLATAIKTIKDNNPDVQIIVATQYNPYKQAASTANQMIADQAKLINDVFNAGVAAMNSMVIQNVCTAVQCTVADVYAKFNGVSENPCNASFDNIFSINLDFHPNASGHRLIAEVINGVIELPAATEYSVTVDNDGNGTATATPTSAAEGTEITLTATPSEGYHFKEWQVISGSVTIENNKFTMPAGNVTVKAIFEKDAATEYTVTVENDGNGTATASPTSAAEGTEVTLIATPNEGYHFKEWKVVSGSVTIENNKFTMPAGDVKVKAVFEKDTPAVTEYTITFNGNGGYVSYTSATTSGGKLSVLPSAYRYGYTFTGWYTASGAQVSTDVIYTADITLYAGWRYIPVYIPEEPEYTRPVKPAEPDEPVAEWVEKNGGTCLYIDGKMVTGWYQDEETGKWYLFDQNTGVMAENKWSKVDGVWYLFDDNGEMLTGWQKVDGKWYYLKPWGGMANGWQYIDSVWYYLRADGSMVANGWVKTGGYWYYLTGSGSMATARWVEWKGDWYYIYSSGIMATNVTIDGYYINSAGVWVQ